MSNEANPQAGRVVWHDLMSTDPDKSTQFFTRLFGWTTTEKDMGPAGKYTMFNAAGEDIGGVVPLDADSGLPSHWISYVAVDDVAAACERATAGGGEQCVQPTEIPNVGTFAVIKDPTGGTISPFKSVHEYSEEKEAPHSAHRFCWDELLTNDVSSAKSFYENVFGWNAKDMDMGEFTYTIMSRGPKDAAGMMPMPPDADSPPHWLPYIAVESVDEYAAKAEALGAKTFVKKDIPNMGRFSVHADPTGTMFALYTPIQK